ncbi:hypothetical protein Poly59_04670 [Rubripirellula reticaptiva]|uniref:3-keto-disaccharide hydrolase domain-containing protein n=2 Tax=Rubripirellula reticaptiva TaxID=2528013 RepID=A0A5C6FAK1_9BACT|nr:hypothetical protein Poly59_04670 [Rubripirellula reticaptiva]
MLISFAVFQEAAAAELNHLQPILAKPGKVVLDMDFETDFVVDKNHKSFVCGQGTTWKAKQGMLVGTESSPEYQAKKKAQGNGHLGTAPRLQIRDSPRDVILKYSFKIVGGKGTKLLPMIEAGHHLRRIYFGSDGSQILVDHEKKAIAKSDFVLQQDQWYHVMIEIKGDEFLVRFQDGPTIYASDPGVGADFANYTIGITATDKGTIYIDNLAMWDVADIRPSWASVKANLAP